MEGLIEQFKRFTPGYFWLSVFFHVLLVLLFYFLNFSSSSHRSIKEESYHYYVPAYTYPSKVFTSPQPNPMPSHHPARSGENISVPDAKNADLSSFTRKQKFNPLTSKEIFSPSHQQVLPTEQSQQSTQTEAIHLVGDKFLDDPLRKLLGRAITRHLYYPQIAAELHLRGIVTIGFMLHPSGEITHARIMKTSRERMLDVAALNAINNASPVNGVDLYVKEPRELVVNIIY